MDKFEHHITGLNKRIDDCHSFIKYFIAIIGIVFTAITITISILVTVGILKFNTERDNLVEFKKGIAEDIEKRIGTLTGYPDIIIQKDKTGQIISESIIEAKVEKIKPEAEFPDDLNRNDFLVAVVSVSLKNIGIKAASQVKIKVYTNIPFYTFFASSDEIKFENEISLNLNDDYRFFPPQYSRSTEFGLLIERNRFKSAIKEHPEGVFPIKLKVYFDNNPPNEYTTNIKVDVKQVNSFFDS